MHIEELLWKAGASPKDSKPLPNNFHPNRPVVPVEPIQIQGQVLDAEFCLQHGFTESSISALNYLYKGSRQNSLLPFLESDSFTIGNFLFRLEPGDYEVDIDFADGVTAAGYATEIRLRFPGSFLGILGLRFVSELTKAIVAPVPDLESLDELSPCSAPPLWVNRRTGKVFTCVCFSYMAKRAWSRQASRTEAVKIGDYDDVRLHPGLCSICSDHIPPPKVAGAGYYNAFLQRYLPYRDLLFMKMFDGIDLSLSDLKEGERVAENAARLAVGYPLIGEKWISEVTLYRTVRSLLAPRMTFHHYQGKELEGQEIDIWVPSLKLAIEYHGPQHFQALPAWGGERALAAAKERDERKRTLLKRLNYHLIEFSHDEQFTEETVFERIGAHLPDARALQAKHTTKRELVEKPSNPSDGPHPQCCVKEYQPMKPMNEETAAICRQIYECMQAGFSQNQASRSIGKSGSWASRWLPIYLRQGADLESAGRVCKTPSEREAERLRRIAEDCERAAGKIEHLFSFDWNCPELSEVSMLRFKLRSSLRAIAQRLIDKRKIILREDKARPGATESRG